MAFLNGFRFALPGLDQSSVELGVPTSVEFNAFFRLASRIGLARLADPDTWERLTEVDQFEVGDHCRDQDSAYRQLRAKIQAYKRCSIKLNSIEQPHKTSRWPRLGTQIDSAIMMTPSSDF